MSVVRGRSLTCPDSISAFLAVFHGFQVLNSALTLGTRRCDRLNTSASITEYKDRMPTIEIKDQFRKHTILLLSQRTP